MEQSREHVVPELVRAKQVTRGPYGKKVVLEVPDVRVWKMEDPRTCKAEKNDDEEQRRRDGDSRVTKCPDHAVQTRTVLACRARGPVMIEGRALPGEELVGQRGRLNDTFELGLRPLPAHRPSPRSLMRISRSPSRPHTTRIERLCREAPSDQAPQRRLIADYRPRREHADRRACTRYRQAG